MIEIFRLQDELLDEAIASAHRAATRLDHGMPNAPGPYHPAGSKVPNVTSQPAHGAPYLTPSPSKDQMSVNYSDDYTPTKPMDIPPVRQQQKGVVNPQWPTPPYDENDWAAAAAASLYATQQAFR